MICTITRIDNSDEVMTPRDLKLKLHKKSPGYMKTNDGKVISFSCSKILSWDMEPHKSNSPIFVINSSPILENPTPRSSVELCQISKRKVSLHKLGEIFLLMKLVSANQKFWTLPNQVCCIPCSCMICSIQCILYYCILTHLAHVVSVY